tara:strand:- start:219 stop:674 length:456 start_codon:yes stop_codon:yes gene_type:complete
MELPEFGGDEATILGGILAAIAAAFLIFLLAFACWYIYTAYFTMKIAEQLGSDNAILAWIPILNIYLLCEIAADENNEVFAGLSPGITFLLVLVLLILGFVPGFLCMIPLWILIARKLNKSDLLGIANAILFSLPIYWLHKVDDAGSASVE